MGKCLNNIKAFFVINCFSFYHICSYYCVFKINLSFHFYINLTMIKNRIHCNYLRLQSLAVVFVLYDLFFLDKKSSVMSQSANKRWHSTQKLVQAMQALHQVNTTTAVNLIVKKCKQVLMTLIFFFKIGSLEGWLKEWNKTCSLTLPTQISIVGARGLARFRHLLRSLATDSASPMVSLSCLRSANMVLLQVVFGRPRFLLPWAGSI